MGGGFAMGCAAGCLIYLVRGMWLSPKSERLYGGVMLLKKRAPILGGNLSNLLRFFWSLGRIIFNIKLRVDINKK